MSGQLVLVSGATGYIASHVVKELLEAGFKVRGTVRSLKAEEKYKHLYDLVPGTRSKVDIVEADLQDADSWKAAVKGVHYICHVASPFPPSTPKNEDELIVPAREGTLNVLRAAAEERSVKRVVVTSSGAAVAEAGGNARAYDENKWADPAKLNGMAYNKSKVIAEKAAWDYHKTLPEHNRFELVTVQPVIVLGPHVNVTDGNSVRLVMMLLAKAVPMCMPLTFPLVDVRDVALAHVRCLLVDEAAGNRHILQTNNMWTKEIAEVLDHEFKSQGYDIPTADMPPEVWKGVISTNEEMRNSDYFSSKPLLLDNTRFTQVLGVEPRDMRQTIIDTAYALIESGKVPKTPQYTGPKK